MGAGYPDRLGSSGKFAKKSAKITCLQTTDQVQYSVMASRTSNQAWSKGLDAGTLLLLLFLFFFL
jgi:phosphoribosyl-AMP cyclohydrolase